MGRRTGGPPEHVDASEPPSRAREAFCAASPSHRSRRAPEPCSSRFRLRHDADIRRDLGAGAQAPGAERPRRRAGTKLPRAKPGMRPGRALIQEDGIVVERPEGLRSALRKHKRCPALGCSQAVRQRFLVPCTVGSNPTTPATDRRKPSRRQPPRRPDRPLVSHPPGGVTQAATQALRAAAAARSRRAAERTCPTSSAGARCSASANGFLHAYVSGAPARSLIVVWGVLSRTVPCRPIWRSKRVTVQRAARSGNPLSAELPPDLARRRRRSSPRRRAGRGGAARCRVGRGPGPGLRLLATWVRSVDGTIGSTRQIGSTP